MLGEKYSIVPRYSFKMIMQNMQMANHVYITTIKECVRSTNVQAADSHLYHLVYKPLP